MTPGRDSQDGRSAGGVLWRRGSGLFAEVALVRRVASDDWSLPRAGVRRGEQPLVAACRAVTEETGSPAAAGRCLEAVHLATDGAPQTVAYWAMRAIDRPPKGTMELDRLAWMSLADARRRVSCRADVAAISAMELLPGAALAAAVLLVCSDLDMHGRPADSSGREQARELVRMLSVFGSARLLAPSARDGRPAPGVQVLGAELGLDILDDPALGEDEYVRHPGRSQSRILEMASVGGGPAAACTSGTVIRHLLGALAEYADLPPEDFRAEPGSIYALFFLSGQLAAADYYPPGPAPDSKAQ